MKDRLFRPGKHPHVPSAAEALTALYGTKGAYLTTIPPKWTAPYVLISHEGVEFAIDGQHPISLTDLPDRLSGNSRTIVRSSVVGETLSDRGLFRSIVLEPSEGTAEVIEALRVIRDDALAKRPGAKVAAILQTYIEPDDMGTFGNLNSISKTREHWSRSSEIAGYYTKEKRFNSQRDVPADADSHLLIDPKKDMDRLFGSIGRWLIDSFSSVVGDRFLLEWVRQGKALYIMQCDLDVDNDEGQDPRSLPIESKPAVQPHQPALLREPTDSDIERWDKLRIIAEFTIDEIKPPQRLYVLSLNEAQQHLRDPSRAGALLIELGYLIHLPSFEQVGLPEPRRRSIWNTPTA